MKLEKIAQTIGGKIHGDHDCIIKKIATLENAGKEDISFLANRRFRQALKKTKASAVLLTEEDLDLCSTNAVVVENPYLAYSQVATLLAPSEELQQGIHPTAIVSEHANVHDSAWIGPFCIIEANVTIESGVQIDAHCVIKQNCVIGTQTKIHSGVKIYPNTTIGRRGIIHSGVVIGADGFGLANDKGEWKKIPQLGGVQIGDDVEMGANTTVDCGAIENTLIGHGVKIDNQVQVAHNVVIGDHTAIAGCVGIAGSAVIGKRCSIGGAVGVLGHVEITDDVVVTGMSFVSKSILNPGVYSSGAPLETNQDWKRNLVRMKQLERMAKRISELEKQVNIKKG